MGYYTNYDVHIKGLKGKNREKLLEDFKSICPDMMFSVEEDYNGQLTFLETEDYDEIDTYFNAKWYQCEEEIGDISFKHPDLKFTIYCRGRRWRDVGSVWLWWGSREL